MTIARRLYLFAIGEMFAMLPMGGIGLYQLSSFNGHVPDDLAEVGGDLRVVVNLKSAYGAFKAQAQQWKNILIRGNRQEDFHKYLKQFGEEETKVQQLLKSTSDNFRVDGEQAVKGMDRATAQGMKALVGKIEKEEMEHLGHQVADGKERYLLGRNILLGIILLVVSGGGKHADCLERRDGRPVQGLNRRGVNVIAPDRGRD